MKYHLKQVSKQASKQASKQGIFLLVLSVVMLQSCSQELKQTESPTAPSASEKIDSTSKNGAGKHKTISGVQPMLRYYAQGAVVLGSTTQWSFVNYVPATSHNGTYTLIDAGSSSFQDQQKFSQYYGFTRSLSGNKHFCVQSLLSRNHDILLV